MRAAVALLLVPLLPLVAAAENDHGVNTDRRPATATPVIGGTDAPAGKWPDVAAVNAPDGLQECTGTLIAPTVVLTAGHCVDALNNDPGSVMVGTNSLARRGDGDIIAVSKIIEYPNSQRSLDIGVLVLAQASKFAPRAIATGWARLDITNGAQVAIVGYGAVDRAGPVRLDSTQDEQYVNELQEATTTITDADCTINKTNGCNGLAAPAGELGAGGMGIDTCPGDSGGPLYLMTDYGTFLAGVTSRSYDDATYYCSEGGLYARPDKVVDWIEEVAGVPVARGPEPAFEALSAVRGNGDETMIEANDPKSTSHTFAITTPPMYGMAAVRDDGLLKVCTDPGVVAQDSVTVTITDKTDPTRALAVKVPITIENGTPGSCDISDFGDGGGCCDAGRGAQGSIVLGLGLAAVLMRRRRRTA